MFCPDTFPFEKTFVPFLGMLTLHVKRWLTEQKKLTPTFFPAIQLKDLVVMRSTDNALNTQTVGKFHADGLIKTKNGETFSNIPALFLGYGSRKLIPIDAGNLQLLNVADLLRNYPELKKKFKNPVSLVHKMVNSRSLKERQKALNHTISLPRSDQNDVFIVGMHNSPHVLVHRGSADIPLGSWRDFSRFFYWTRYNWCFTI